MWLNPPDTADLVTADLVAFADIILNGELIDQKGLKFLCSKFTNCKFEKFKIFIFIFSTLILIFSKIFLIVTMRSAVAFQQ